MTTPRRTFLRLGLFSALALGAAGAWLSAGRTTDSSSSSPALTSAQRDLLLALGRSLLDGRLPQADAARQAELENWLNRLHDTIRGLAPPARSQLQDLLMLLTTLPGRRWFAGVASPWAQASTDELTHALQGLRSSSLSLRQQAYHGLRDLTMAAYYADPGTWTAIGYPGPQFQPQAQ